MESISYNSNKWNTNLLPNTLLAGLLLFFPLISNNTNYCYIKEFFVFSISAIFILYYLFFKNKILIYVYDIYIIIGIIYILSNTNNWDNDTYTIIHYIIIFFSVSKAKWDINILFIIISISTIHTIISIINNWSSPLIGIMNNSGITGIYLAITYPIGLFFLLKIQRIVYKIIYGSILTLSTICILLTDSRSAILSITICTIYIYIKNSNSIMNHIRKNSTKKSSIYILLFISLCIVSLYNLINHRKESVDGRILIYKITTKMISDKPIFGFGYNTFYSVYPDYQASYFNKHPNSKYKLLADNTKYGFNEILQIGVENGITGIILIFILTICLLTINNNEDKFIVSSLKYSILSILIVSLSSYPLRRNETLLIIIILVGILVSFEKRILFTFNRTESKLLIMSLIFFYFNITDSTISRKQAYTIWLKTKKTPIPDKEKMAIYGSIENELKYFPLFLYNYAVILSNCQKNNESNIYLDKVLMHMNTSYIWILKGNNYKNRNNFQEALKCYTHASEIVPNRIFPLYKTMLLYKEYNRYNQMIDTAELINKFNIKIPSYTTLKIKKEANEIISTYNN